MSHLKAVKITLQTAKRCMICFKGDLNQSAFVVSTQKKNLQAIFLCHYFKNTLVVLLMEQLFIIDSRFEITCNTPSRKK